MSCHLFLLLLLSTPLLLLAEGSSESQQHHICSSGRFIAFKKLGGIHRVASLTFRNLGNDKKEAICTKVLADTVDSPNSFVTFDCRVCARSGGGAWRCQPLPAAGAPPRANCRMALGPDCKYYAVNKDDESKPCV